MSCGAETGSSCASGDENDKDTNSSHRVNEPEVKGYPHTNTLGHSSAEDDTLTHSATSLSKEKRGIEGEITINKGRTKLGEYKSDSVIINNAWHVYRSPHQKISG